MSDDDMPPGQPSDENGMPPGFQIGFPAGFPAALVHAARDHDAQHARAEAAAASAWRFVEDLDTDQLMAFKWILTAGNDGSYAVMNSARWEAVAETLLRTRGINPDTGIAFGAELLEES